MTYIKRHLEDAVLNMSRSFSAILQKKIQHYFYRYTDRLYSLMKSNMHLNYLRILRFISTNITIPAVSG